MMARLAGGLLLGSSRLLLLPLVPFSDTPFFSTFSSVAFGDRDFGVLFTGDTWPMAEAFGERDFGGV